MRRIAVFGAGAIGGTIGGLMARGGQDVTLIDTWMDHVKLIRERGLRIDGVREQHQVKAKALHTGELGQLKGKLDILVVCVKSYETEWAIKTMTPHLHDDTWVISAQNCLNEETIAPMVGARRTLGCVIMLSTWLTEAGHIRHFAFGPPSATEINYNVGELDGRVTPRIEEVCRLFSLAGGAQVTTDLWGERWSKLAINCMGNALAGMGGMEHPKGYKVRLKLGAETIRVGRTLGYRIASPFKGFTLDQVEQAANEGLPELEQMLARPPSGEQATPSLRQDVLKGRKTEVDYLNGYVVKRGAAIGVPAPFNAAVTTVIHGIEAGEFTAGKENVDRVYALAGASQSEATRRPS